MQPHPATEADIWNCWALATVYELRNLVMHTVL